VLQRGELTVVAGSVGTGKTVLVRAVLGHLPRTAGRVLWNGRPVVGPLQPPLAAYTPQRPGAFTETLHENVLLGEAEHRLAPALAAATLDADLAGFPDGWDTQIGPRGHRLSGGQLHRLAAARMLARPAALLVIDDLSAALDVHTEALLWQRILDDHPGRTALVVSNRPACLRRADRVVVMSGGRIAAQGSYEEVQAWL
jgi:ATP-binding cassette subfamily B protein